MNVVVYITNRQVYWPVLIVTSCNRDSSLITAKDDRNYNSTMCVQSCPVYKQIVDILSLKIRKQLTAFCQHQLPENTLWKQCFPLASNSLSKEWLVIMVWMSFQGSQNQPYSAVFHAGGALLLGGSLSKL